MSGVEVRLPTRLGTEVVARALQLAGLPLGGDVVLRQGGPAARPGEVVAAPGEELADVLPRLRAMLPTAPDAPALTARERQVLALLAEGAGNEAVATTLGISRHTARTHVQNIFAKLGADNRVAAAAAARRLGLLAGAP